MFDYIFYRLYDFYNKNEKGVTPITTAALYLSVLQILMAFSIILIVNITLKGEITLKTFPLNSNYLKFGFVVAALLLDLYNYKKYKRKYKTLIKRYQNHKFNKKFKVWMLYFIGAGIILLPIIYKSILKMF